MIYESINKICINELANPHCPNNQKLFSILEKLLKYNRHFVIGGSLALALYYNKIISCSRDIDMFCYLEDKDFWLNAFKELNFSIQLFNNKITTDKDYCMVFSESKKVIDFGCKIPSVVEKEDGSIWVNTEEKYTKAKADLHKVPTKTIMGINILDPEIIKYQKLNALKNLNLDYPEKHKFHLKYYFNITDTDQIEFTEKRLNS